MMVIATTSQGPPHTRSSTTAGTRAAQAAQAATATTQARYRPATVARRISRLEAQAREVARRLEGYTAQRGTPYAQQIPPAAGAARERYTAEADRLADELDYWRGVRAEQVAAGQAADYSRETISAGGLRESLRELVAGEAEQPQGGDLGIWRMQHPGGISDTHRPPPSLEVGLTTPPATGTFIHVRRYGRTDTAPH